MQTGLEIREYFQLLFIAVILTSFCSKTSLVKSIDLYFFFFRPLSAIYPIKVTFQHGSTQKKMKTNTICVTTVMTYLTETRRTIHQKAQRILIQKTINIQK